MQRACPLGRPVPLTQRTGNPLGPVPAWLNVNPVIGAAALPLCLAAGMPTVARRALAYIVRLLVQAPHINASATTQHGDRPLQRLQVHRQRTCPTVHNTPLWTLVYYRDYRD